MTIICCCCKRRFTTLKEYAKHQPYCYERALNSCPR
jgi:hypothetical protein